MKLGRLGNLGNRSIMSNIARFAYLAKNRSGLEEYVLVFEERVPVFMKGHPIYHGAKIDKKPNGEIHLTYPEEKSQIILTNIENDDKFREKHPEIAKAEAIRIDEVSKPDDKKEIVLNYGVIRV